MEGYKVLSQRVVRTPIWMRRLAWWLLAALGIGVLLLGFLPWQQTVMGTGEVTALAPHNRPQSLHAPINGQVEKWYLNEGDKVDIGDPIVKLRDLKSEYLPKKVAELKENSRQALQESLEAQNQKIASLQESIDNLRDNMRAEMQATTQDIEAKEVDLDTANKNLVRQRKLFEQGLSSQRDFELATQKQAQRERTLRSSRLSLMGFQSKMQADLAKLYSERASALAKRNELSDKLAKAETELQIATNRRELSIVRSPVQGTVVRLFRVGSGATFKQDEQMAIITPETQDQAVALVLPGRDAPLVFPGEKVRLQFSGWPAIQFAGFSDSMSIGTFGGVVKVVDNVDIGQGKFRLLVVPDPEEREWPSPEQLRPGTKVAGWVILRTVPLGYELWRRFNILPLGVSDVRDQGSGQGKSDGGGSSGKVGSAKSIFKKSQK